MGKDLYRDRLNQPLKKEVLNFISSLQDDLWIVEEDIIGTEIHNIMLFEQKILTKNEIRPILRILESLKERFQNQQIELDANFEDIHPFIEKCVIEEIGMEIGGKIHTGRSRNDQVSVDIRLKIRKCLNEVSRKLLDLFEEFLKISKNTKDYTSLYPSSAGAIRGFCSLYQ